MNVEWHSDPWQLTVTSRPIRLSTNFMTLIPSLNFTELRVGFDGAFATGVACQQGTHTLQDIWFHPLFGTCLCSNYWDQISRFCRVFTRLFILNTLRYFLDFAFIQNILREFHIYWNIPFNYTTTHGMDLFDRGNISRIFPKNTNTCPKTDKVIIINTPCNFEMSCYDLLLGERLMSLLGTPWPVSVVCSSVCLPVYLPAVSFVVTSIFCHFRGSNL